MESINHIFLQSASIRRRARSLLVFSLFTAISAGMATSVKAQTFAEWFDQKNTQKKYLLQQIAALQVYSGYLKNGYQIASGGLTSISGSLTGENSLHATYYGRMKTVDPVIRNNLMVAETLSWQQNILTILSRIDQVSEINQAEKSYLIGVRSAVLKDCDTQVSTLQAVISDGKLNMSDAERVAVISKIHTAMMNNYRFASGFITQVNLYTRQRQQEKQQTVLTKQIYGIK